jgi:hypothetical protein
MVRARLSAGLRALPDVTVDDGRAQRAERVPRALAVHVTEWPNDIVTNDRAALVCLVDSGVSPPSSQLARGGTAWLPLDTDAEDVRIAALAVLRGLRAPEHNGCINYRRPASHRSRARGTACAHRGVGKQAHRCATGDQRQHGQVSFTGYFFQTGRPHAKRSSESRLAARCGTAVVRADAANA